MERPCCDRFHDSPWGAFDPADTHTVQWTLQKAEGQTEQKGHLASGQKKVKD